MYSAAIEAHFANPRNLGELVGADAVGLDGTPGAGPYMRIALKMQGATIAAARFETYGCPTARGCGSFVTTWVVGRTLAQAGVIEAEDLRRVLGGLPLGKEHCADLAVHALRDALRQLAAKAGERP